MMKPTAALAILLLAAAGFSAQAMPPPPSSTLKGEVLETQNVENYTYLRLKTKDGETWAAVPKSTVKKGQQVTIGSAMTMENFESTSLKRKFDKIVFGELVDPNAKPAPSMATPQSTAAATAAPHGATPAPAVPVAKVTKASGPDAKTVAEVVKGKAALKGKTVLVRGQVVKASIGILGKNWFHLQDGSGSAAESTNDILVTSTDTAAVGDIVNARGTVRTDVNVGSGYAYAVLIEEAALRK